MRDAQLWGDIAHGQAARAGRFLISTIAVMVTAHAAAAEPQAPGIIRRATARTSKKFSGRVISPPV
jgi:hypothetical protein